MADQPKIADRRPQVVELEAGKNYAFCTCGESSKQPFCDGSHSGSSFTPNVFSVTESKKYWLCMCKRTGNSPFCDGAHSRLAPSDD